MDLAKRKYGLGKASVLIGLRESMDCVKRKYRLGKRRVWIG